MRIDWPDDHTAHLTAGAQAVFDTVVAANRVGYRDDIFEGKVFAPNTVHPLGGVVRGSATDGFGRVKGYDNLFVNDASLIPGYIGCKPFMSIAALAVRNIEGFCAACATPPAAHSHNRSADLLLRHGDDPGPRPFRCPVVNRFKTGDTGSM